MRLKELRKSLNLTQSKLSQKLNIPQSSYALYENDKRDIPTPYLISLAKFYDVSVDYILELTEIEDPYPQF